MQQFSPTQRHMLEILKDGSMHSREELQQCLPDDLGSISNVKPHLTHIRKILRERGEDIRCILQAGGVFYQHIRLMQKPPEE